jgi:hypothetical protein
LPIGLGLLFKIEKFGAGSTVRVVAGVAQVPTDNDEPALLGRIENLVASVSHTGTAV